MKPLLRIGPKDFLSGISLLGAHTGDGLFYRADGVTPLFNAGGSLAIQNGLLMAGSSITTASYGSVTGNILNSIVYDTALAGLANCNALFSLSSNKVARMEFSGGVPTGSLTTIFTAGTTLTPGIAVAALPNGLSYIFYRQIAHMGYYEPGVPTQTDAWQSLSSDYFGALHYNYSLGKYIFGNGVGKLGTMTLGATIAATVFDLVALDFDATSICTALADDGFYTIAAISRNRTADMSVFADSHILFWDGSSPSWTKEHTITDPLIHTIKKTPFGIFAFGNTGIWQVTLEGVKKVFNYSTGIYSASGSSVVHYGQAATFFANALMWAGNVGSTTARAVKTFGKLDSAAPSAYLHPLLSTSSKNITHINAQLSKGYVYWSDDTPALYYAPIGTGTPAEGVSAQTVYFQLPTKYQITRVDVVFGEPLSSNDSVSIQLKNDEDTTATPTTALAATYTNDGAIRRKSMPVLNFFAEDQFAIVINFTGGSGKIKQIDVFGTPVSV